MAAQIAVAELSPLAVPALRFFVSGLLLACLLAVRRTERLPSGWRDWATLAVMGITGNVMFNLPLFWGLQYATGTDASLVTTTSPIFVALLAALFLAEPLSLVQVAGILSTVVGAGLVITGGSILLEGGLQRLLGDLLFFVSALSWSIYILLSRPAMRRFSPMALSSYGIIAAAIILLAIGLPFMPWGRWGELSIAVWVSVTYLGLSTAVAFLFWNHGVELIGASRSAVFGNLTPVFTMALAVTILREVLLVTHILGVVLIMAGVWLTNRRPRVSVTAEEPLRSQGPPPRR